MKLIVQRVRLYHHKKSCEGSECLSIYRDLFFFLDKPSDHAIQYLLSNFSVDGDIEYIVLITRSNLTLLKYRSSSTLNPTRIGTDTLDEGIRE